MNAIACEDCGEKATVFLVGDPMMVAVGACDAHKPEHTTDEQCAATLAPSTAADGCLECSVCHTIQLEPCDVCGGTSFHRRTCAMLYPGPDECLDCEPVTHAARANTVIPCAKHRSAEPLRLALIEIREIAAQRGDVASMDIAHLAHAAIKAAGPPPEKAPLIFVVLELHRGTVSAVFSDDHRVRVVEVDEEREKAEPGEHHGELLVNPMGDIAPSVLALAKPVMEGCS